MGFGVLAFVGAGVLAGVGFGCDAGVGVARDAGVVFGCAAEFAGVAFEAGVDPGEVVCAMATPQHSVIAAPRILL